MKTNIIGWSNTNSLPDPSNKDSLRPDISKYEVYLNPSYTCIGRL